MSREEELKALKEVADVLARASIPLVVDECSRIFQGAVDELGFLSYVDGVEALEAMLEELKGCIEAEAKAVKEVGVRNMPSGHALEVHKKVQDWAVRAAVAAMGLCVSACVGVAMEEFSQGPDGSDDGSSGNGVAIGA